MPETKKQLNPKTKQFIFNNFKLIHLFILTNLFKFFFSIERRRKIKSASGREQKAIKCDWNLEIQADKRLRIKTLNWK